MTSKTTITVFTIMVMLSVSLLAPSIAYATSVDDEIAKRSSGSLEPVKEQSDKKQSASAFSSGTSKTKNFSWTDCSQTNSGSFTASLTATPTDKVKFTWSWPASVKGGLFCDTQGFDWMFQSFTNITENWTVYSGQETANSNTSGKTYSIVDTSGNPLYVTNFDIVKASESACYNQILGICTVSKSFETDSWVAI